MPSSRVTRGRGAEVVRAGRADEAEVRAEPVRPASDVEPRGGLRAGVRERRRAERETRARARRARRSPAMPARSACSKAGRSAAAAASTGGAGAIGEASAQRSTSGEAGRSLPSSLVACQDSVTAGAAAQSAANR